MSTPKAAGKGASKRKANEKDDHPTKKLSVAQGTSSPRSRHLPS